MNIIKKNLKKIVFDIMLLLSVVFFSISNDYCAICRSNGHIAIDVFFKINRRQNSKLYNASKLIKRFIPN